MKKSILMKLFVLAVCAAMLLSLFACDGGKVDPTEASTQQETEAPATEKPTDKTTEAPTQAENKETTPKETEPAETTPAETTPAETTPAETTPAETTPAETTPAETTPAETEPKETEPEETEPKETEPEETEPEETDPACDGNHKYVAKGDQGHYCEKCGVPSRDNPILEHTYDYVDGAYQCTACAHVPACKGEHTTYGSDEEGHWVTECLVCGAAAGEKESHTGATVEGKYVCTVCAIELPCPATHVWGSDAEGHWMAACDVCGAAATDKAPHSETKAETVTATEYVLGCADCGYAFYTKAITEAVSAFVAPEFIANGADNYFQLGGKAFEIGEDGIPYASFTGTTTESTNEETGEVTVAHKTAQVIWMRSHNDMIWNQFASESQQSTLDIGSATYLVIKAKTTNVNQHMSFTFSTTGHNSPKAVATEKMEATRNGEKVVIAEVGEEYNVSTGYTSVTIPFAAAEAGVWTTYVINLAKVAPEQMVKDAETDTYVIDTLYFHFEQFAAISTIDIAHMAFVEGDWSAIDPFVDEETVVAVNKSGAGAKVYTNNAQCIGEHSTSIQVVDGIYKKACDVCGAVVKDYNVSADAASLYWPADILYGLATQTGSAPYWSSWTGKANNIEILEENGETFLRLGDGESNKATNGAWGGWFPLQSQTVSANGQGRYMVLKVRRNSNISGLAGLNFWITSQAGYTNTWAAGGITVVLGQDNTWHTIVVDLAERCGDAYKADDNGGYDPRTVHIRPFGSGSAYDNTTDETFDIAYWAFFDSLEDIPNIVKDETYEISKTNTSSVTLVTATGECKSCVPTYVADAEDARGYHYECANCGKKFAMDYYESGKGGAFNYLNGTYAGTVQKLVDSEGFGYVSFLSTGTSGTFFNYNSNHAGGGDLSENAVHAGRFLVMKLRGKTAANVTFHIGTDDFEKKNNNYVGGSVGALTVDTMPGEWTVVIIDLTGLANYSLGETHKIFMSSTTGGGSTVANGAQVDLAYVALFDELAAIEAFVEGETVKYYGTSLSTAPIDVHFDCDIDGHLYNASTEVAEGGVITNTYTCVMCGNSKTQTVSADINYFVVPSNSGNYGVPTFKAGLTDAASGVIYSRYEFGAKTGSHLNITGGTAGDSGKATTESYKPGRYFVIKMRGDVIYMNVAVGKENASGAKKTVGSERRTISDDWQVLVLDMSSEEYDAIFADLETSPLYIMLTTASTANDGDYVDIAYIAIVDTLEEARSLLVEGETYYDLGTNWKATDFECNADGSYVGSKAEEPIEVTFDENMSATVKVPAQTTFYFAAPFGLQQGMILTANGEELAFVAGNRWFGTPSTFSITNDTDAAVEYTLVASYPVGSMMNPEVLEELDDWCYGSVSQVQGTSDGYYYTYTAPADGTVVFYFSSVPFVGDEYEDPDNYKEYLCDISITNNTTCVQKTLLADGVDFYGLELHMDVKAGDELVIVIVAVQDTEGNYYPAAEMEWVGYFAYPAGTENNPIYPEYEWDESYTNASVTVTVPAGATVYFIGYNGMINTVNGEVVELTEEGAFSITNNGEADAEYTIALATPVGHSTNPEVFEGDSFSDTKALDEECDYNYIWTATKDGKITLIVTEGANITVELLTYVDGEEWPIVEQYELATPIIDETTGDYTGWDVAEKLVIDVVAGQEVKIQITGLTNWETWLNTAVEYTFNFAFEDGEVEEPSVEPVADLILNVDTLQLPSQKYSSSTATVDGVDFEFVQLGNYGDGLQMRDKNGNTTTFWNTSAFKAPIARIELVYSSTKDVQYANADAVIFTFGNAAGEATFTTKLSTTAGVKTYTITPDAETYTFFKLEHDLGYTFYWDSITIVFADGTTVTQ